RAQACQAFRKTVPPVISARYLIAAGIRRSHPVPDVVFAGRQRGVGYLGTLSFRGFRRRIVSDHEVVTPRDASSVVPKLLSQITHFGAVPWPSCFSNLKTASYKSS